MSAPFICDIAAEATGGEPDAFWSWWTPSGWGCGPAPAPFEVACECSGLSWKSVMEGADYTCVRSTIGDTSAGHEVWRHRTGHLVISILEQGEFFVAKRDVMAFWIALYPSIQESEFAVRKVEALEIQSKALVAWVRFGNGELTISEFGETRDERDHRMAVERAARQRGIRRSAA